MEAPATHNLRSMQKNELHERISLFPIAMSVATASIDRQVHTSFCFDLRTMPRSSILSPRAPTRSPGFKISRLRTNKLAFPVRLNPDLKFGGVRKQEMTISAALPSPADAALLFVEVSLAVAGPVAAYREANGVNNRYSKFASDEKERSSDNYEARTIPSKTGMFVFYFPAALIATLFFACRLEFLPLAAVLDSLGASGAANSWKTALVVDSEGRLLLVAAALFLHFSKRVLEVLFVHQYSGSISVKESTVIAAIYASQVSILLYSQLLSTSAAAPFPNLKWLGVALFLIGVTGNAYHHWLLSQLRKDGNNSYVVPHGGLFDVLVCPHYVFEMIDFMGIAIISQTLFGLCMASFVILYLSGRAIATKKWYSKKVEDFPEDRSVLIPGIF